MSGPKHSRVSPEVASPAKRRTSAAFSPRKGSTTTGGAVLSRSKTSTALKGAHSLADKVEGVLELEFDEIVESTVGIQQFMGSNQMVTGTRNEKTQKIRACHTFKGWWLSTWIGQITAILICTASLILGMAGSWMLIDKCEDCDYDDSFSQATWLAWGIFFDPGTQTGIPANTNALVAHKAVAALFSVLGFVFNLVLLGVIVERIRMRIARFRKHHLAMVCNDHVVVLGWTDKTLFLLEELAQMLADGVNRGGTIICLAQMEPEEMRSEVRITYPDWSRRWPKVKLRFMQGKPHEIDDLMRVSAFSASIVVVLGVSRNPREADSQVITMICALRCLPIGLSPDVLIVAELRQAQTKSVARQMGGTGGRNGAHSVLPVAAGQAIDALLVLCAMAPTAGEALMDLLSFSGNQCEVVEAEGSPLVGRTFGEARLCFGQGVLVGVIKGGGSGGAAAGTRAARRVVAGKSYAVPLRGSMGDQEGEAPQYEAGGPVQQDEVDGVHAADSVYRDLDRVQLAPPDGYRIKMTDQLVVVAADRFAADAGMRGIVASRAEGSGSADVAESPRLPDEDEPKERRHVAASRIQASSRGKLVRNKTQKMRKELSSMNRAAPATRAAVLAPLSAKSSRQLTSEKSSRAMGPQSCSAATPKVVLLVGWSQSLGQLLRAFDARLPDGSEMYILADREMSARQSDMEADGIALDGSARESRGQEHECEVTMDDEASGIESCGLRHIRIRHVVGFVTDYLALRRLPVRRADIAVIVVQSKDVSDVGGGSGVDRMASSQLADSEAMTATMLLRRIRDECAGATPPPPLQLVTQLADVLTRRLLDTQPELLNTSLNPGAESNCCDTLIMHRNYMETTTLSVAAANQSAWSALRTLIYPGGGADINTLFAASIIPPVEMASNVADGGTKFSFWQLSERVRKKGYGVLVGWRRVPRAESKAKKGRMEQAKEALFSAKEMAKAAAETAQSIVKDAGGGSRPGGSKASLLQKEKEKTVAKEGGERGILELNPMDKDRLLTWRAADLLVVIAPDGKIATANDDLVDVQADAGKRQTAANVMRSQTPAKGDLNAVLAGGHKPRLSPISPSRNV